jgi:hypothetical protein
MRANIIAERRRRQWSGFRTGPEKVLNPLQSQRTWRHQWRAPVRSLPPMPISAASIR